MHLTQSYIAGCVTNIKPPGYKTKRHDDECMKLLGLPNGFEIAMNFFHTSAKNQSSFKLAPAMSLLPCKHKKVNLAGAKTKFGWCKLTNWMASLGGFPFWPCMPSRLPYLDNGSHYTMGFCKHCNHWNSPCIGDSPSHLPNGSLCLCVWTWPWLLASAGPS